MNNKIEQFKKALKLDNKILSIYFTKKLPKNFKHYQDTACTALARAFLKNETLVFGAEKYPQLCPGASYFLDFKKIPKREVLDVYIKQEHVFKDKNIYGKFLKDLPKFPIMLKDKFIVIKPFAEKDKHSVIVLLATPAQASRIIGIANYEKYSKIEINPSQPTCLALFAPLSTGKMHINFLDYYDRYYQGKINGKNIWPEDKMLISMCYHDLKIILNNLEKSSHGSFKPDLLPQKVGKI